MDVDLFLGRTVVEVVGEHGAPYLLLEDGMRMEYDAMLVAVGQSEVVRNIQVIYHILFHWSYYLLKSSYLNTHIFLHYCLIFPI